MADWTQYNFDFEDCDATNLNCIKSIRRPGIIERVDKSTSVVEEQPKRQPFYFNPSLRRKGFIERVDEYEEKKKNEITESVGR